MKNRRAVLRPAELNEAQRAETDLHGLTAEEAEFALIDLLEALPKTVRAVRVTHGYSHGVSLKRMVRQDFTHWRVAEKRVESNPGVTWLILK